MRFLSKVCLSLALILLALPACCQIPSSTLATGSVIATLSMRVPSNPAESQISPPANLPASSPWRIIPEWLGGTWETRSEILLEGYDYRNQRRTTDRPVRIPVKRVTVLGTQRDSQGRIWHYAGTPYVKLIDMDDRIERQIVERVSFLKSDPDQVIVSTIATVQKLDRNTKELLDVFVERSTTTYVPMQDGLIQVSFVIDDFDLQGQPLYCSKLICTQTRLSKFAPVQQDARGDLSAKFREFLSTNGMSELLP